MNVHNGLLQSTSIPTSLDILLADVAIRVQLSVTEYNKAVDRYQTMQDWIDRPSSPLHRRVVWMYPQGSMRIGATIARASDRDEYDIDVMAEIDLPLGSDPEYVLNLLHDAIRVK